MGNDYNSQYLSHGSHRINLLIMLANTSLTSLAMLASKWPTDHASRTKVLFIKLPSFKQFINDRLLLAHTAAFRYEAWIFKHGLEVEECAKPNDDCKNKICEWCCRKGSYTMLASS